MEDKDGHNFIIIDEIDIDSVKYLVCSYNVNGCGHRSMKVLNALVQIKTHYQKSPTVLMVQECRRPIFKSHVPGYQLVQKFACEEDLQYSTRLQQPGTGNVILVKQGVSYNLLEWECWSDQILTIIIFEDHTRYTDR